MYNTADRSISMRIRISGCVVLDCYHHTIQTVNVLTTPSSSPGLEKKERGGPVAEVREALGLVSHLTIVTMLGIM